MSVAGVDGVPGGWVVCVVDTSARSVRWSVEQNAAAVLAATQGCAAVGVDIPLALPEGAERRASEVEAVARLGDARAALFFTPPRAVLDADTHELACTVARELTGKGISLQAFHIGSKILDWQSVTLPDTVVEVHPELSFRALAPDVKFAPKKRTRGSGQRIAALSRWLDAGVTLADLPAGARMDDVLDALVAAWSAERWARGEAAELGPGRDSRGRRLQIVV